MWYVNLISPLYPSTNNPCFILTMWYVNQTESTTSIEDVIKFYINYVVCKFDIIFECGFIFLSVLY